jgi:arylsulfatase A-like enzyme
VHLPAILVAADGRMAGQRSADLVTPADVGATLIDLAGLAPVGSATTSSDARSLIGLFTDWQYEPRDRVIVAAGDSTAIVTRGWHLVAELSADGTPVPRLFAKPDDFFELSDVADRCPAVAEELLAALAPGAERPLSAEALG